MQLVDVSLGVFDFLVLRSAPIVKTIPVVDTMPEAPPKGSFRRPIHHLWIAIRADNMNLKFVVQIVPVKFLGSHSILAHICACC